MYIPILLLSYTVNLEIFADFVKVLYFYLCFGYLLHKKYAKKTLLEAILKFLDLQCFSGRNSLLLSVYLNTLTYGSYLYNA